MQQITGNNLSLRDRLSYILKRSRGELVETDLSPYYLILQKIEKINYKSLSDSAIREKAVSLKNRLRSGTPEEILLPEAFALVREGCRRVLKQDPYDVQILAGIVIHRGKLAQMRTGEGKTMAAVFPGFLWALAGKGLHILTANEYLARRDGETMGKVFSFLTLETGYITEMMPDKEKKAGYGKDITYLTLKQAGFDFLRDHLVYDRNRIMQRGLEAVIVDEADFLMIDEARIPLVIAAHAPAQLIDPQRTDAVVRKLKSGEHFTLTKNRRDLHITPAGHAEIEALTGCGGAHEEAGREIFAAVFVALHAHHLLTKDVDYIVKNGCIELIDEFTGRLADKRKWPYGIQPALEAKEGLTICPEGRVYSSITIENFINLYRKKAAMTATAVPAAREFSDCYRLPVVVIPPAKPEKMLRKHDRIFLTREQKTAALVKEIARAHKTGRPVLIGTVSVGESQELASVLAASGIECRVLNAKQDKQEARLIACAGNPGAVTVSTNMAGRGTDIKLGGGDERLRETVIESGGLYVIGTNRHESIRIDNQLAGRAGRQGDPGEAVFFISLEDDLFSRYGIREFLSKKSLAADPDGLLTDRRVFKEIKRAQEIIEAQHSAMKAMLRKYSRLVEMQRKIIRGMRDDALLYGELPECLSDEMRERLDEVSLIIGEDKARRIFVMILLHYLDEFQAGHIQFVDDIREGIHLQRYGGKDPLLVFIKEVTRFFEKGLSEAVDDAEETFLSLDRDNPESILSREAFKGPTSTWTYLINDDPLPAFSLSLAAGAAAAAGAPFLFLLALVNFFRKIISRRDE